MRLYLIPTLTVILATIFISCGSDDSMDTGIDQQIEEYIQSRGINAQKTSSGLYYEIKNSGSSERPSIESTVIVDFVGTFVNGQEFQSTYIQGSPIIFPVAVFIPGFQEGIQLFGRGGSGILIIPPKLAFGSAGTDEIPPNSILVFNLELVDFYDDADVYNDQLITEYLNENNIVAEKTESGLYYVITEPGLDPFPVLSSTVTIDYHGYRLDGTVFDSSIQNGNPIRLPLSNFIPGWQEGIQLFGTGGKGMLFVPSSLAYGSDGAPPDIGRDTPLIFNIEVIKVE